MQSSAFWKSLPWTLNQYKLNQKTHTALENIIKLCCVLGEVVDNVSLELFFVFTDLDFNPFRARFGDKRLRILPAVQCLFVLITISFWKYTVNPGVWGGG